MQQRLKKIVVLGPESTGKSSLCAQLAIHYKTIWCPEFARQYLLEHGMDYSFADLLTIAQGQLHLEESYERKLVGNGEALVVNSWVQTPNRLLITNIEPKIGADLNSKLSPLAPPPPPLPTPHSLFIDTDMYVMKVWCEFVFGQCHTFILDQIAERRYDLYLLCKPDLPWVKDELREYPDLESREKLYLIYKDMLINQATPWAEISGGYEERLSKAITAVDAIL